MATPDMDVIKEIPGYKVILKAVLKSQIQQLVEQLATTTDEESVILTASVGDGTLSHLGSDSGKTFLEDHEDIKSQFLGFCLKRHHKQKQEKMEKERQEALARVAPVTPPRYGGMGGPRASYMPQRSPRFTSPRNQGPHPVALSRASTGALRNTGQGGARHEPYPTQRAPRRGSLSFDQGPGPRPNVGSGGQVIKVEPTDDEQSNQSAPGMTGSDTAQGSSEPSSPSVNQTGLQQSTEREDDAKSESSSSTIPNESSDLKQTDNVPPGGLSLGSDLSSLIPGVATTTSESVHDTSGMDPNVSVKLEAGDDGDMDLEITGVELGSRPGDPVMASSQDWAQQAMGGMPTGASGGPGDMTAQQGYSSLKFSADVIVANKRSSTSESPDVIKEEIRALRRKIRRLEDRVVALESGGSSQQDNLLNLVSHLDASDVQQVLSTLCKALFSNEELMNCSRTGKRTNKCSESGPRPPLDIVKLEKLERLVCEKTNISKDCFCKKLENMQKTLRQKKKQ